MKRLGKKDEVHLFGPRVLERDVERYLVQRVKALGGEVRKVQWIGRRGAPDRLVMFPVTAQKFIDGAWGTTLWVELKAPGKKPEPHQMREHARMRAMGQRVAVIDSRDGVDVLIGGAP